MKLVNTKDYLLLIDEEVEIKEGDWFYNSFIELCKRAEKPDVEGIINANNCVGDKIIAYYPLTKEAKELDLPLLPPFEENFTKLNKLIKEEQDFWYNKTGSKTATEIVESCISIGYKAAQQSNKQFNLEDIKKAIEMAREGRTCIGGGSDYVEDGETDDCVDWSKTEEQIIQSLSAKRLPVEFIPSVTDCETYLADACNVRFSCCGRPQTINTITIDGKTTLEGVYKYE